MALFLIGIGFLVKAYPDTIAGYNTMSKEKKKNVDIVGFSTFMKKCLITTGVVMIILSFIFKLIHFKTKYSIWAIMSVYLIGLIIVIIRGKKFDGNRKKI